MLRAIWIMDGIAAIIITLRLISLGFVLRKVTLPDWLMLSALPQTKHYGSCRRGL
jgi:hypothetical protein